MSQVSEFEIKQFRDSVIVHAGTFDCDKLIKIFAYHITSEVTPFRLIWHHFTLHEQVHARPPKTSTL